MIRNNNFFEKKLLRIFFIIFVVLFFDSIYQFLFNKNILNFSIIEEGRISSFFRDELIMGSYVVRFFTRFYLYIFLKNIPIK